MIAVSLMRLLFRSRVDRFVEYENEQEEEEEEEYDGY